MKRGNNNNNRQRIGKNIRTEKDEIHKKRAIKWLAKLSGEERGRVCQVTDKTGTKLLKSMYRRQRELGEGIFFEVADVAEEPGWTGNTTKQSTMEKLMEFCKGYLNTDGFLFRRYDLLDNGLVCYPEKVFAADVEFGNYVRLCDTKEYCDTITLAQELLADTKKFQHLLCVVTRGRFLSSPCRVKWNGKSWVWNIPTWFSD